MLLKEDMKLIHFRNLCAWNRHCTLLHPAWVKQTYTDGRASQWKLTLECTTFGQKLLSLIVVLCGLGCVTRTLARTWFTQPIPCIFLHFCTAFIIISLGYGNLMSGFEWWWWFTQVWGWHEKCFGVVAEKARKLIIVRQCGGGDPLGGGTAQVCRYNSICAFTIFNYLPLQYELVLGSLRLSWVDPF